MFRSLPAITALTTALVLSFGCDSGSKESDKGKAPKKSADAKGGAADVKAGGDAKADGGDAKADGGDTKADGGDAGEAAEHVGNLTEEQLAQLRKDAAEVKKLLTEAREKAKAEDWPAAVAAYEKAVEIDDDNVTILGELGWAQFSNKDLKGAEHNYRLALRYGQSKEHRADMLYKLGRVEEERGEFDKAKQHYDQSLALADNAEVKGHDDAVGSKAEAMCKGGKCAKPDYADLQAACDGIIARIHEQQGLEPHSADDEFTCKPEEAQKVALTGGDATEAAILVVKGAHAGTEEEEYDLLAHIEGGWHWVGTLLDLENPHHGGIERSGTLHSLDAKEILPTSPGPEILVKVEVKETDADLDDNIVYHDEHEAYIVCGINEWTHVCYEIPTRMSYKAEALDPAQKTAHDLTAHEFIANAEFDGKGNVTVSGKGEVPEAEKGTHPIAELPEPDGFVFLHEE